MSERVKRVKEEILGVVTILGSVYLALSLYSYSVWDPAVFTFSRVAVKNYGGVAGAQLSDFLVTIAGISSFAIPVFLLLFGLRRLLGIPGQKIYFWGSLLFVFSSSLMLSLLRLTFDLNIGMNSGGLMGSMATGFLEKYLSTLGAYLCSMSAFLSSVILLSPVSLSSFARNLKPLQDAEPQRKAEKSVIEEEILVRSPEKSAVPVLNDPLKTDPPVAGSSKLKSERPPKPAAGADGYTLPSVDLLTVYDPSARPSKEELLSNSALLESKLSDFGVEGKITQVHPGPVVTMYEFEPAPGVKINRVVSLADDLALAQKAQSMRVSPIPGKAAIGIEVPNKLREIVSFREIVSSEKFVKSYSKITLALGKDIFGGPVVADLAKMPHLLVAGATGAGKSVSINSMVMSIIYKSSPSEVKMLMIDPKLLELSMYEGIPHLLSPVITNPRKAAEALRKMVIEMERRYRLLAEKGARNIDSFNRLAPDGERLPYIVIFIDELADLMFASSNEVEDAITRLAQMARAAGIHLIIATQRPSVDVITGLIKANFPARISFQVFSKIDSRTILDMQGAEQLLGKGDMLLMLPGSRILRVHGALVTEAEIGDATSFIKSQGTPDFSIFEEIPIEQPPSEGEDTAEKDEMFDKAVEFADSVGEVSISSLQRRFKMGYNRAARIMEIMEEEGMVGPPKAAGKPRDFLRRHR
jgi:DNA segregation ATPase FtsK/SpoIIIE, S-DNA-T family